MGLYNHRPESEFCSDSNCVALGWSLPSLNLSFFLCKVGIEISNVKKVLRVQGKVLASKG